MQEGNFYKYDFSQIKAVLFVFARSGIIPKTEAKHINLVEHVNGVFPKGIIFNFLNSRIPCHKNNLEKDMACVIIPRC